LARHNRLGIVDVLYPGDWIGMELFGIDDRPPKDVCLSRVRESDVYLARLPFCAASLYNSI